MVVKEVKVKQKDITVLGGEKKVFGSSFRIILHQRITEKSSEMTADGAYTFNVSKLANKKNVKEEVSRIYKVTPTHVRITRVPSKVVFSRGKLGVKGGGKKAYVTLKKGERIEFV